MACSREDHSSALRTAPPEVDDDDDDDRQLKNPSPPASYAYVEALSKIIVSHIF